jgi:PIN domain nuclease of toxin-antitoxin system
MLAPRQRSESIGCYPRSQTALPVLRPEHIAALLELPAIHRDPFYRMLIAKARAAGMTFATLNRQIREYGVSTIW